MTRAGSVDPPGSLNVKEGHIPIIQSAWFLSSALFLAASLSLPAVPLPWSHKTDLGRALASKIDDS